MDATITSERLLLRLYTADEAAAVVAGKRDGRSWSPGYPTEGDLDIARAFVRNLDCGTPESGAYGPRQIVARRSGLVIGGIGFFGPPDAAGVVSLGYGVVPEVRGRGVATEALRALLAAADRAGEARVARADATHDNLASQRVMEKAGMHRVGNDSELVYYEISLAHTRGVT